MLQEFYVTVTRKLARPLDATAVATAVSSFAELPLVQIDAQLILSAIHRSRTNQLSFWDALVVQASIEGNAGTLYSEDMQHRQSPVGNATFAFANGNTANFTYGVNGVTQTKSITRQVFRTPGTICQ